MNNDRILSMTMGEEFFLAGPRDEQIPKPTSKELARVLGRMGIDKDECDFVAELPYPQAVDFSLSLLVQKGLNPQAIEYFQ